MNVKEKYLAWLANPAMDAELLSALRTMSEETIHDSFYRDLAFGTGGLRGVLGPGTNRMNTFTVMKATRGLGRYLLESFSDPSCAISCDSRIHSRDFSKLTAAVFASMGIRVFIYPQLQPTPMLSFAVRHLHTSAGVMITASHNPAPFNGYKVYGPDGCQITLEAADRIQQFIALEPDLCDSIPDYDHFLNTGMISLIGNDTIESYYQTIMGLRVRPSSEPLHIVYSPLNGAGNIPVREILHRLGNIRVEVVPQQELPDGNFPTCPYPNPEIREAMELAIEKTVSCGADLCFATDPDCDRMGAGVRVGNEVVLISGNDMGILMLDYLCRNARASSSGLPRVAVKTIVTTEMAAAVCRKYNVELRNVLTGFKFIGEQIGLLEKSGTADRFLFGFEESYGYLSGTDVRDKDAVNAALLLADMAANLKAEGKTLLDRLNELRREFGYYAQRLLTFQYEGEDGAKRMNRIMTDLRAPENPSLSGHPAPRRIDYLYDETGLPKSNVLEFYVAEDKKYVVRPSGTEPKLKAYLFARGDSQDAAEKELDLLEKDVRALCE